MQKSHHGQHPIWTLPHELLEQIFLFAGAPKEFGIPKTASVKASLNISWVCHNWRSITLSSRAFWAQCVSLESRSRLQPIFLTRSHPHPLDIYGGVLTREERLTAFKTPNVACRVRTLHFHTNVTGAKTFLSAFFLQDLPLLEAILLYGSDELLVVNTSEPRIVISSTTLARAPKVKTLRCRGVDIDLSSFSEKHLLLQELQDLDLSGPMSRFSHLPFLLSRAKNIRSLILVSVWQPGLDTKFHRLGVIYLSNLTTVSLTIPSTAAIQLLPDLSFSKKMRTLRLLIDLRRLSHYAHVLNEVSRFMLAWPDLDGGSTASIDLKSTCGMSFELSGPRRSRDADDFTTTLSSFDSATFFFEVNYQSTRPQYFSTTLPGFLKLPAQFGQPFLEIAAGLPMLSSVSKLDVHVTFGAVLSVPNFSVAEHPSVDVQGDDLNFDYDTTPTVQAVLVKGSTFGDILFANSTFPNVETIQISRHNLVHDILHRAKDAMNEVSNHDHSSDIYSFLPKLRSITFPAEDSPQSLTVFKRLIEANFYVELVPPSTLRATHPGRYQGELPTQRSFDELW